VAGALTVTVSVLTVSLGRPRLDDARRLAQLASSIGDQPELQSSDPGNVGRWLESRLGYEVEIPSIPGARLTGGRVVTMDGENLAAVTYVVGGTPLVYFAIPTGTLPGWEVSDRTAQTARIGRYHVATWIVNGAGSAIVAPMPKRDVQAVAEECRGRGGPDP